MFGPNVYISGIFSVYLRPNVYIYIQMSILMSNGCGFLCLRLGLAGRESGRAVRISPLFQRFRPTNYTFHIYLRPNVYIQVQMCIFMTNLIKFLDIEGILRFCAPECALYTSVLWRGVTLQQSGRTNKQSEHWTAHHAIWVTTSLF